MDNYQRSKWANTNQVLTIDVGVASDRFESVVWIKGNKLLVTFSDGSSYVYQPFVLVDLFDLLLMAENLDSFGKAFNNLVKDSNAIQCEKTVSP